MPSFDRNSLNALKELSRINLTEEEENALLDGITKVLRHAEHLQSINTNDVPTTDCVIQDGPAHVYREDIIEENYSRKTFLDNAPDQVGGMVRTPSIIETQGS